MAQGESCPQYRYCVDKPLQTARQLFWSHLVAGQLWRPAPGPGLRQCRDSSHSSDGPTSWSDAPPRRSGARARMSCPRVVATHQRCLCHMAGRRARPRADREGLRRYPRPVWQRACAASSGSFFKDCRELADWLWQDHQSLDKPTVMDFVMADPDLRLADGLAQSIKHTIPRLELTRLRRALST